MVVWLRNSLVVLIFMTETSEALNQQTENLKIKKFGDQEVVLGKGFEESYVSPYINDDEAIDLIKKEYQESKYGMNQVNYNDIVVEDLSDDRDGFLDYMKKRVKDLLGFDEEEKEKQIIEARPGQQFDKGNVPTENPLYQYHLNNLKEENIIDGKLTTVFITGITNPDDGKIYNVPGFVDGKIIKNESQLQQIAKEKNWFDTYPSYNTGEEANQAAQELKKFIDRDGEEFLSSVKTTIKEEVETPIIPKEKPSDNELLYSKLSSTNYFKSIRDVESKVVDGKVATEEERNNAVGDDGASLGSYQIQRNFFKESMEWLKSNNVFEDLHNKSYEDIVKDPNQATKIMFGYYMRYAPNLIKDLKLEQLARLHNGGPGALKSDKGIRLTNDYADKFNQILKSYSSQ